jgi:cysteine sulfinate desulfinase/cysteine desulfurase-like protein
MRLSQFPFTAEAEVDYIIEKMPPIINKLRELSPFVTK